MHGCGKIAPRTGRAPSARACGAHKNTNFTDRVMNLQATVIGNISFEFIEWVHNGRNQNDTHQIAYSVHAQVYL